MNEAKVSTVRRLLAEAAPPDYAALARRQGPLGTVRRKFLIQQARLLAGRYSLQAHMDAYVYGAGREAVTGLDLEQLEQLVAKLAALGAALDVVCDPVGAPPAR